MRNYLTIIFFNFIDQRMENLFSCSLNNKFRKQLLQIIVILNRFIVFRGAIASSQNNRNIAHCNVNNKIANNDPYLS